MGLRNYSFNRNVLTEKELSLFEYLVDNPNYKCNVGYEIITNALEGKIDYSKEFNLPAYENKIKRNLDLASYTKSMTELPFEREFLGIEVDEGDNYEPNYSHNDDIVADNVLDNLLYDEALSFIKDTKYYMGIADAPFDMIPSRSLVRALQGYKQDIRLIKSACDTDNKFKEYITILLERGNLEEIIGG